MPETSRTTKLLFSDADYRLSINDYPENKYPLPDGSTVTTGDLHGNAKLFLWEMLLLDIMQCEPKTYDLFTEYYSGEFKNQSDLATLIKKANQHKKYAGKFSDPVSQYTQGGYTQNCYRIDPNNLLLKKAVLDVILDGVRVNPNAKINLRNLGDDFADRGESDDAIKELYRKLFAANHIDTTVMASNHVITFLKYLKAIEQSETFTPFYPELIKSDDTGEKKWDKQFSNLKFELQIKSLVQGLMPLVKTGAVSREDLLEFGAVYKKHMQLVSCDYDEVAKTLNIHSHAPIDNETIIYLGMYYKIPGYENLNPQDAQKFTAKQWMTLIDQINIVFRASVLDNTFADIEGPFDQFVDQQSNTDDYNINLLAERYNNSVTPNTHTRTAEKLKQDFPAVFTLWNRCYCEHILKQLKKTADGVSIHFFHGHDSDNSNNPENALTLDSPLGKTLDLTTASVSQPIGIAITATEHPKYQLSHDQTAEIQKFETLSVKIDKVTKTLINCETFMKGGKVMLLEQIQGFCQLYYTFKAQNQRNEHYKNVSQTAYLKYTYSLSACQTLLFQVLGTHYNHWLKQSLASDNLDNAYIQDFLKVSGFKSYPYLSSQDKRKDIKSDDALLLAIYLGDVDSILQLWPKQKSLLIQYFNSEKNISYMLELARLGGLATNLRNVNINASQSLRTRYESCAKFFEDPENFLKNQPNVVKKLSEKPIDLPQKKQQAQLASMKRPNQSNADIALKIKARRNPADATIKKHDTSNKNNAEKEVKSTPPVFDTASKSKVLEKPAEIVIQQPKKQKETVGSVTQKAHKPAPHYDDWNSVNNAFENHRNYFKKQGSCFSQQEVTAMLDHVEVLINEAKPGAVYFNKARKLDKINGLYALLTAGVHADPKDDVTAARLLSETKDTSKPEYHDLRKGWFSSIGFFTFCNRTAKMLDQIEQTHTGVAVKTQ